MIIKNEYDVPFIVSDEYDINKINSCMELILGMKENLILNNENFEDLSNCTSLSLLQMYCAEILLSMEKRKHIQAFEIIEKIKAFLKEESDTRSLIVCSGLSALLAGDYYLARNSFYELLIRNPKDIFSFYVTHMIEFNNGMTSSMLETLHAVKDHWSKSDWFYGYCKGIEAFILNENGFYSESLSCGEEALLINKDDIYALHAICHHYYDTHAYRDGRIFMERHADSWKNSYGMRLHLYWHYALFLIKDNRRHLLDETYQLLRKKNSMDNLEDLDATSFLFRLSLDSDVGSLHNEAIDLVKSWDSHKELGFYFFNDFHAALIFSISGRIHLIDYLISQSKHSRPTGYYKTKVTLLNAIKYHALNEYEKVADLLSKPIDFRFMGGSNAQRSIIKDVLVNAKNKMEITCEYK